MQSSAITDSEIKYPAAAPRREGYINVSRSPHHTMYWAEYGNPEGEPVLFVHGGPGAGTSPWLAQLFDPKRYRIILFDQRGCGKSFPHAADQPNFALQNNTTDHLIADIEKLRDELGIEGKMHIYGGSWGSTLALAYAIKRPKNVQDLVLRGVFLCRKADLDYFYQGNATDLSKEEVAGAYKAYDTLPTTPEVKAAVRQAWRDYVAFIPEEERGDMVKAYAEIFAANPHTPQEQEHQDQALRLWTRWEGITSYRVPDISNLGQFEDLTFARAFARLENHYFMNGVFLGGAGEANRTQNYLLENIAHIKDIPVHIVHGDYDQVCPKFQADDLVAALKHAGAKQVDYRVVPAGHSLREREVYQEVQAIMDSLPKMPPKEKSFSKREDARGSSAGHTR